MYSKYREQDLKTRPVQSGFSLEMLYCAHCMMLCAGESLVYYLYSRISVSVCTVGPLLVCVQ